MKSEMLAKMADGATVLAGLTTALAVLFGYMQFSETQQLQRETQAVDLFVKYNEIMGDDAGKRDEF